MHDTTVTTSRRERRRKARLRLTRSLIARFGAQGVVVLDIHEAGARIEHFAPLTPGRTNTLLFEWQGARIECEARVVASRVHRFADGEHGGTVYQSGLSFTGVAEDAGRALRELMSTSVARSVAEQVANLRGLGPVTEKDMPVFQAGMVTAAGVEREAPGSKRMPIARADHGYTRCVLVANRYFEKRWTRNPLQPAEGFTVLATEPRDLVDMLCEDYLRANDATRRLIRILARITVEESGR